MRKYFFLILILGFIGYAGYFFTDSVTPYVSVADARAAQRNVQVKGVPDGTVAPHMEDGHFVFSIADEDTGETMLVRYKGAKPDTFDDAYHVVAIGKYTGDAFAADKLLIKCPSKYEEEKGKARA
ncbi:cytochrome c maturation protein CcmE domain-containing protein [Selenomonas sp. oral taxon 136]|uniref:cytochrome c maturation protein CcmE domain-containing protein n=1 Tax=Selenomonas sp. oral taxon 136 TaxID=713030 RepID=UPI00076825DF|nr:cytochrome c maturation protein CcmE [Selenomonas sp. oral taxon 136]AME02801.1 cytochrome C biogenesis protein [Selenomonas sp. oral taxon 136]